MLRICARVRGNNSARALRVAEVTSNPVGTAVYVYSFQNSRTLEFQLPLLVTYRYHVLNATLYLIAFCFFQSKFIVLYEGTIDMWDPGSTVQEYYLSIMSMSIKPWRRSTRDPFYLKSKTPWFLNGLGYPSPMSIQTCLCIVACTFHHQCQCSDSSSVAVPLVISQ